MVIDAKGFEMLEESFEVAEKNGLLLYDIMTERYEITTKLQKELSQITAIFGELEKGSLEEPAITKESVHHLFKYVSGEVLTRPAWFLDVSQQGEGIVDVMTHLVDLVQWECFPEQVINYPQDIEIMEARHWTTDMNLEEFHAITKKDQFSDYLLKNVNEDSILQIHCNGEINYKIKGVHAKTSVTWAYKAPEGTGDTHYSIMRGTKANLVIRQGADENYQPTLYLEPQGSDEQYDAEISDAFASLQAKYPGIELEASENGWKVNIPASYKNGHEAHFAQVMENYLEYLQNGNMPSWEIPNMLAKYYTTTKALEMVE
jgi:predicted dehydrogenase